MAMVSLALIAGPAIAVHAQGATTFDPMIYRAAVAAILGDSLPDTVMVGPRSVRLRLSDEIVMRGGQVNERLHQFDAIPSGLPERLDEVSLVSRPAAELPLPPGFVVLDDSSAARLAAGDWRALRRRVPAARGVVHLTPVAHASDGATALVGVIWECGAGCRRMYAAWLVPDGTGGWTVQGTHRFPAQ